MLVLRYLLKTAVVRLATRLLGRLLPLLARLLRLIRL